MGTSGCGYAHVRYLQTRGPCLTENRTLLSLLSIVAHPTAHTSTGSARAAPAPVTKVIQGLNWGRGGGVREDGDATAYENLRDRMDSRLCASSNGSGAGMTDLGNREITRRGILCGRGPRRCGRRGGTWRVGYNLRPAYRTPTRVLRLQRPRR